MHELELKDWIGRTETCTDQLTAAASRALAATLDRAAEPAPGDSILPGEHWLYFTPSCLTSEIGADGHARRGGFLPPVPLPRRMWAGSRLQFLHPLRVGHAVSRTSRIVDVSAKQGRSGALVFVPVRHEIAADAAPAVIEEQDIVYRGLPKAAERSPSERAPLEHEWTQCVEPDPVLLFRYSALTFNSHRIHYDRRYATEVEGYPGLVVHGPLIATLLLELLRRHLPDAAVSRFSFRAVKPTFDTAPFALRGKRGADGTTVHLWAQHEDGSLCVDATATLTTASSPAHRGELA